MPLLALLPAVLLSHRYQLCNFSCPSSTGDTEATAASATSWLACRSEKCTPRLAEDACADGSEAKLLAIDGKSAPDDGLAVAGPQECEELFAAAVTPDNDKPAAPVGDDVQEEAAGSAVSAPASAALRLGSFDERCGICMGLAVEANRLWTIAAAEGPAATLALAGSAEQLCGPAAANIELEQLPTVRTCRLHPPACAAVLAASSAHACAEAWEMLTGGASASAVRAAQQARCGALMTQRNGSGVDDALICPQPRDVGARVMAISAVLAVAIFGAQWAVFRS